MATLAQQATIASNAAFRLRVMMAAILVALEVFAEDAAIYEHNSRLNFARLVTSDPMGQQIRMAACVCTSGTIVAAETTTAGSSADADILTQVRASWNALSGVAASNG